MRAYNANFVAQANAVTKSPRYVAVLSFDTGNTDLVYLTSHADAALPVGVTSIKRVIETIAGTSQAINPIQARATIGVSTLTVVDRGEALTDLINAKLYSDKGLRKKRVRIYMGFEGEAWTDYELIQTQIVDSISFSEDGKYTIQCADIQRSAREDIFDLRKTTLTATLSATATTLTVASTADFEGLEHGLSFVDAPPYSTGTVTATNGSAAVVGSGTAWLSKTLEGGRINIAGVDYLIDSITDNTHLTLATNYTGATGGGKSYTIFPRVGYVRLEDEVIRYPISEITDTTFTKCVRGVLGTKAVIHEVDANADADRQPEIEEFVYLEMPGPKLALAILTGSLYGQTGAVMPDNWHLGIDASYIATNDFVNIGTDWWDTSDDRLGRILRFAGEDKVDGKQFYEQQINLILGAFNPVYRDGSLGLKRMTIVLSDASPVAVLSPSNIETISDLTHDMQDVHNQLLVKWNYFFLEDKTTRKSLLTDSRSISRHGTAPIREVEARGLHGSRHTQDTLFEMFDSLRSRHAGPPQKLSVTCLPRYNFLEVGDCVLVNYPNLRDFAGGVTQLYRTFEIQNVQIDWSSGRVSFELFGSAESAGAIAGTDVGATLDSDIYTTGGIELSAYLNANFPGSFTTVGGVGHIQANCTLTGNAALASGKYRYDGDLTIDAGVTVTITDNVLLAVGGFFQVEIGATIDGAGNGIAASTNGTAGFIGSTQPMGGLNVGRVIELAQLTRYRFTSEERAVVNGKHIAFPTLGLQLDNGVLMGLPGDLRGTSGGRGGALTAQAANSGGAQTVTQGGNGGASGAGLCIVSQGADFDGDIDLSGDNGSAGAAGFLYENATDLSDTYLAYSGAGAGGCPGACLIVLDGAGSIAPENKLIANMGDTPAPSGIATPRPGTFFEDFAPSSNRQYRSYHQGLGSLDMSTACFRVMFAPEGAAAEEDVPRVTSVPSAIDIDEFTNTPQTPNQNLVTLEVSVTPPSDGNYSHSVIKYRVAGSGSAWSVAGVTSPEALIVVPMDGTQYEIAAFPVSIFFVESLEYLSTLWTVPTSTAGGVTLGGGVGGYIRTSDNVGGGSSGQGVILDEDGLRAYNATGGLTFELDAATGNVFSAGELSATTGTIGGWDITADTIEKGNVVIDSANERIQVGPTGATFVRIDEDGILGVDAVLGTTFLLPTDGSAPQFSSGIIRETIFELYTASVIKTADNPAATGGVLLNNTGIKGYNGAGALKFFLNATDGTITAEGAITITGGSGFRNLSDAGAVYQIFFQSTAPTSGYATGDYWIDSDDNSLYRRSSSSWVQIQDDDIGQALLDAADAQATADGKIKTFYQATAPTAESVGDIWIDSDDNNKPYRWSGSAWVAQDWDGAIWSKVTGSGRPSDNADVSQTAITAGVTITGGGITMSGGGSIKGGQTGYDTGNGFFIGYSPSAYKLSVGDSNGQKLTFDGSYLRVTGHFSAGSISAPIFYSSGSHLTTATSNGSTTVSLMDASGFPSSGAGYIIGATNNKDAFTWTGKSGNNLTGCSGVLTHSAGAIVIHDQSVVISSDVDEVYGYGDRGDGTLAELYSLGITSVGGDGIIINAGSTSSGYSRAGLRGASYDSKGVIGISINDQGGAFQSLADYAVVGESGGYIGGFLYGADGNLTMLPFSSTASPSHDTPVGCVQVRKHTTTSNPARMYFNTGVGYSYSEQLSDSWGEVLVQRGAVSGYLTSDQTLARGIWFLRADPTPAIPGWSGTVSFNASINGTASSIRDFTASDEADSFVSLGNVSSNNINSSNRRVAYTYYPM